MTADLQAAVEQVRDALSNVVALARPHFSDRPQMLALKLAEQALGESLPTLLAALRQPVEGEPNVCDTGRGG